MLGDSNQKGGKLAIVSAHASNRFGNHTVASFGTLRSFAVALLRLGGNKREHCDEDEFVHENFS